MEISYPYPANHFEAEDFGFILIDDKNNIASIKYRDEIGRMYPLPGGGVEDGEEWIDGLIREAKEEVGCNITDIKPVGSFGSYDNPTMRCFKSIICTAKLQGEPVAPAPTEDYEQGSELVWKTADELIKKIEDLADPEDSNRDDRSRFTLEILKKTLNN
ncbi:MAG: NUDIX hydrolase [Candidatus Paceibacterota bacterium]